MAINYKLRRFKKKISLFFDKFERLYYRSSSARFEAHLRKKGIQIGKNIYWVGHKTINIDTSRPCLVEIGDNVCLNAGLTILSHDFATYVFRNKYKDYVSATAKVTIGSNIMFGQKCTVLKGVTIGDNCIIGTGSLVTKDIPANSVAAGIPAKVICTLDEYYKKRKTDSIEEAKAYAREIQKYYGREPVIEDFEEEFALFWTPETKVTDNFKYRIVNQQLGSIYDEFVANNIPLYSSFRAFLDDCELMK